MEPKRLYRSLTDRKIAGVAGGLAEYFDTDPLLLRLAFVVLAFAGGGGVLIYFILWVVTPEKPVIYEQFNSNPPAGSSPDPAPSSHPDPFQSPDPFKAPKPSDPSGKGKGSLIGGLVLITLGALFLVNQLVPNIDFGDLWPILLVVIGAGLLINAVTGRK